MWSTSAAQAAELTNLPPAEFVDRLNAAFSDPPASPEPPAFLAPLQTAASAVTRALGNSPASPPFRGAPQVVRVRSVMQAVVCLGRPCLLSGLDDVCCWPGGGSSCVVPVEIFPHQHILQATRRFHWVRGVCSRGSRGDIPPHTVLVRRLACSDAAHTVHPLAGQGMNLGIADAMVLARLLEAGSDVGQDLGTVLCRVQWHVAETNRLAVACRLARASEGLRTTAQGAQPVNDAGIGCVEGHVCVRARRLLRCAKHGHERGQQLAAAEGTPLHAHLPSAAPRLTYGCVRHLWLSSPWVRCLGSRSPRLLLQLIRVRGRGRNSIQSSLDEQQQQLLLLQFPHR